jgi:predicted RNA-binding Zn ribbon-like protein
MTNPAPGRLETVRQFINTYDVEDDRDELETPQALVAWLTERALISTSIPASSEDLATAVAVRESLRALSAANHGDPLDRDALENLNRAATAARLSLRFDESGHASLQPDDPGVGGAIGRLLAIVANAMADGTWSRLKVCRNSECAVAFYDSARNRSGKWCDMAICGNRMKARAFRARQTQQ